MGYLIDTENISLDYSENRELPYRITIYDKYGHFDNEFFLSEEQVSDLKKGLNNC
jgi:hypothetical protein